MSGFGFSISDLVQVSNLAIRLWRRCRDSPKEFMSLAAEVANLRNLVDDVRLTVKERQLSKAQTDQILDLGQGCLNCLLELEALLRKYQSLGGKAKRTFDRLGWDKGEIAEIRQTLTFNTNLLNSFNITLTRSSTARIEDLLRGFLEDYKAGRHEGSVLSVDTIRSIQQGDDDVWRELQKELEASGITEEQVTENKKFITEWIVKAIQSGNLERKSIMSGSYHTATDGGSNRFSGTTMLSGTHLRDELDFPGAEFRWCKERLSSVDELYKEAPEQYSSLQAQLSETRNILIEIGRARRDVTLLSYHEHLCRKPQMVPLIDRINADLKGLQMLETLLKRSVPDDDSAVEWVIEGSQVSEAESLSLDLSAASIELKALFHDLDTMLLCNLEDNIRIIIVETNEKQRSASILSSWDELEAELVDGQDYAEEDIRNHQEAVMSFLRLILEERSATESDGTYHILRSGSIGNSSVGILNAELQSPPGDSSVDLTRNSLGKSRSSITESDGLPSVRPGDALKIQPKRTSVLFVDLNNTVRSPMAQAYLEYLVASHPHLAGSFSRIHSAGLTASKPGVPLFPGVEFMLRDYGINPHFSHTSRRLERRDVEKFEYVLAMNCALRDEILSLWPLRKDMTKSESPKDSDFSREDLQDRVVVLGSFGNEGDREVSIAESINQSYWFHVGTKRIYPGYDPCFREIKAYVADFVYHLTGFDVHGHAMGRSQEIGSRNMSQDISEDEGFSEGFPSPHWDFHEERSGFEVLRSQIERYQESRKESVTSDHEQFPDPDSPIQVRIRADQQSLETDEEVLHKHHEQFDRLMSLLLTDIGDNSFSSHRRMVMDWNQDNNRNILTVKTGIVQWVLEKSLTDPGETCYRCASAGTKSGFVRDAQFEVIGIEEADVIAEYLSIAIKESRQEPGPSDEQTRALESIRDSDKPRPPGAPSIKDDVSISVRNDKPRLEQQIAKIRQRDAQSKLSQAEKSRLPNPQDQILPRLSRRQTAESDVRAVKAKDSRNHRESDASQATVKPHGTDNDLKEQPTGRLSPVKDLPGAKSPGKTKRPSDWTEPISVLFLGSSHLHGAIMAEVYLFSRVEKSLALLCRLNDVVSAGVTRTTPDQKLNPKKLERLFKSHDILNCWPQKPERLLVPEDALDFDYILTLNSVNLDVPYQCWADDNPDEAREMKEAAVAEGQDWKTNFKSKVRRLTDFDEEQRRDKPLADPVQPPGGEKRTNKFGVRMAEFEKHFERVCYMVDQFLLKEIGFDVETNQFLKDRV